MNFDNDNYIRFYMFLFHRKNNYNFFGFELIDIIYRNQLKFLINLIIRSSLTKLSCLNFIKNEFHSTYFVTSKTVKLSKNISNISIFY